MIDLMRSLGIELHLSASIARVTRQADGEIVARLEDGRELRADELLVATGRNPHTGDLGLETIGLSAGSAIPVDEQLRASGAPWLYVIGDANGRGLLTHMGKYHARVAADVILGRDARVHDGSPPPRVIFTDPQVAAVGHTLDSAKQAGIDADAVEVEIAANAGASFHGRDAPGTCRIVVDRRRRVLVGATFTGPDTAELMHSATVAIAGRVTIEDLAHAVPTFPTRTEIWLGLLGQLER